MRKRKKGNVIILFLAFLLGFLTLVGIYINVSMSYQVYNRIQTAVEEGAKIRAQAVDIYLKEATGIVESFHPHQDYGLGAHPDIDHDNLDIPLGNITPLNPTSPAYVDAYNRANAAAKQAILAIARNSLQNTASMSGVGNEIMMNFDEGNICIQVKPLPRTNADGNRIDFSCTTPKGDTIQVDNVKVTPIETRQNRKVIFDPDGIPNSGDEHITEVVNVVFVASTYQHRNFLEGLFPQMSPNIRNVGTKTSYAVAYPQIDRCFGEFCADYESLDD